MAKTTDPKAPGKGGAKSGVPKGEMKDSKKPGAKKKGAK